MSFLTRPITSDRLEAKGQSLYKTGKIFTFIGICGFSLFALILIIAALLYGSSGILYVLSFDLYDFEFVIPLLIISYISILLGIIGVPMYFSGLNIFALGRIAHNTEKE
jgi:hypothetical protein